MFRKIVYILITLFVFVAGAYFIATKYFHIDENAVKTLVESPSQDVVKLINENPTNSGPFTIYGDYKIGIFADLGEKAPRVLSFDNSGTLFTSITGKGEILALPDADADGKADRIEVVSKGLNRPHGIVFYNDYFYIAETDRVVRYKYGSDRKLGEKEFLFNLPGGGRHFTRTIKVYENKLYTSVGSSCDVCVEKEIDRASILVSDLDGSNLNVFATGLRNTVFFDFAPSGSSGEVKIWGSDMGRDFLGDNLPPDELNVIENGGNYGWPWCYGNKAIDSDFNRNAGFDCSVTRASEFNYPAHNAPLGTTFIKSGVLPKSYEGDLLVSFHGSWNSTSKVGYKIVRIDIENGKAVDMKDFITGFADSKGNVIGRPVDLVFDSKGNLYISDDKANVVYVLTKKN